MKRGLIVFGLIDLASFLVFFYPKFLFVKEAFGIFNFTLIQKLIALSEFSLVFLFLLSGIQLIRFKKAGIYLSILALVSRMMFHHFSLDVLLFLIYNINPHLFNNIDLNTYWKNFSIYIFVIFETLRYAISYYALNKSSLN